LKALLINDFFGDVGGAESYFHTLCRGLHEAGVEVVALAADKPPEGLPWKAQSAHTYAFDPKQGISRLWNAAASLKTRRMLKREKPDVVHAHNVFSALSMSVPYACVGRARTLMTLHDYRFNCPQSKLDEHKRPCPHEKGFGFMCTLRGCALPHLLAYQTVRNWISKFVLPQLDVLVAPSSFMKKMADAHVGGNTVHIPHGIDVNKLKPAPMPSEKTILFLGRLVPDKGLEFLLRAMPEITKEVADARLAVAGDGPLKRKLMRMSSSLNLKNVEFLGKVPNKKVAELYANAKVVCMPSIWPDNAPMVAYEAMAAGRPLVASRVGGLPDLVVPAETGYLVPPRDVESLASKISNVLADEPLAHSLGEAARRRVDEKFSLKRHIDAVIEAYENTGEAGE